MEKLNVPKLRFGGFEGGFIQKRIDEISIVSAGATPLTSKKDYWNGNIRWMNSGELNLKFVYEVENRITELGLKKTSTKLLPIGCVLIGLAGQGKTRGTVAMNMIELCTNQSVGAIHPNNNVFSEFFLYHNLDFRYDELRNLSTGDGGRGGLNLSIIKSLKINLPSLPEQQKIASFLTAVDDKIQLLNKKKELLSQYKKGVMQKIFNQEIRFKDDDGKDYPDWEEKSLGEVFEHRVERNEKETELLSVTINSGIKKHSELDRHDTSNTDKSKYLSVKKGDLVYNSMRMWQGASGKSEFNGIVSPAYTVLNIKAKNNVDFFAYMFKLKTLIETFQKHSQGLTSDTWNLKYPKFKMIKVFLPQESEQTKIANFLSSIDDKINLVNQQIVKSQAYKKGLLQQMFV